MQKLLAYSTNLPEAHIPISKQSSEYLVEKLSQKTQLTHCCSYKIWGAINSWTPAVACTSCFHGSDKWLRCDTTQLNSLGPSDTIWQHRSGSTLAQVMACWMMAPSHYLKPWGLLIREVMWHSSESMFTASAKAIIQYNIFSYWLQHLTWPYELTSSSLSTRMPAPYFSIHIFFQILHNL